MPKGSVNFHRTPDDSVDQVSVEQFCSTAHSIHFAFVVLLNASDRPMDFSVPFPPGKWRWIGDGRQLEFGGLPGPAIPDTPGVPRPVKVPAVSAYVFLAL